MTKFAGLLFSLLAVCSCSAGGADARSSRLHGKEREAPAQLPPVLVQKLERADLRCLFGVLSRNLRALLQYAE